MSTNKELKIVLLGSMGVGKTCLIHRFVTGDFDSSLPVTIGAAFSAKSFEYKGQTLKLQVTRPISCANTC
jgi:GTPase SAR1 family protein